MWRSPIPPEVASKAKLVPVPVPIRMPRVGVADIAVGERHVVARSMDDQVPLGSVGVVKTLEIMKEGFDYQILFSALST